MLNILLIDDHELFRAGLKLLLADLAPSVHFAEASTCAQALEVVAGTRFDLVLFDLHLPGLTGVEALQTVRAASEDSLIVAISAEDDPSIIRQIIDAGAGGFIPKSSSHAVMMAALRLVLAGGTYLPANALFAAPVVRPTPEPLAPLSLKNLTQRQIDTLRLAIHGKANKVIARELDISEATVKAHLSASFRALGVRNRTEAVFAAARIGLVM